MAERVRLRLPSLQRTVLLAALLYGVPVATGEKRASTSGPAAEAPLTFSEDEVRRILQHSPLPDPVDETNRFAGDPRAVRLGQFLFFDEKLSADGTLSCASCHAPERGFADGKAIAEGLGPGTRNTLTVLNVAYNRWYFWDGRADTLWSQALQPLESPNELGADRVAILRRLVADERLEAAYEALFGAPPGVLDSDDCPEHARPVPDDASHPHNVAWQAMDAEDRAEIDAAFANVGKAIAAYEMQLVGRRAPFDVFVEGLREDDAQKRAALSLAAQRGLRLFIGRGNCRLCHSGPQFTDGEFHDIRVPTQDGGPPRDAGRYRGIAELEQTGFHARSRFSDAPDGMQAKLLEFLINRPDNWGAFKTPSLRNVSETAPYMHQGQFASLAEVVEYYSTLERARPPGHHARETILRPLEFSEQERADLVAFLKSLTDVESIDPSLRKPPASPIPVAD